MSKIILLDIDCVLLIWRDGFYKYMEHAGVKFIKDAGDELHYDMTKHFDLTSDEVYEHIGRFNDGHWTFGVIDPIEGSQNAIKELTAMGYRFVAISCCSTTTQSVALRKANLYNLFGDVFDAVHCIGIRDSKNNLLSKHEPTFWIEDNFKNCVDGLKFGHDCILLTHPWNENEQHDDISRCDSWAEIVKYIKNS